MGLSGANPALGGGRLWGGYRVVFGGRLGWLRKGGWTGQRWTGEGEQEAVSTPLATPVPREGKHKATATQKPEAELAVSHPFPAQMLCRGHCVSQAAGARALGPWRKEAPGPNPKLELLPTAVGGGRPPKG